MTPNTFDRNTWHSNVMSSALSDTSRIVGVYLIHFCDDNGENVDINVAEISDAIHFDWRAVVRATRDLQTAGLIKRVYEPRNDGSNASTTYRLTYPSNQFATQEATA